jgi:hypothetical protein
MTTKKPNNALENSDLVPLTLRIPKPVHGRLKDISESEFRSLNHQIIMALSYFIEVREKFGMVPHPEHLKKMSSGEPLSQWLQTGLPGGRTRV